MEQLPTIHTDIKKVSGSQITAANDVLAVEEPLEIKLAYCDARGAQLKNISVTMRTPGCDEELALGFLYTEGIIQSPAEVSAVTAPKENAVTITLKEGMAPAINNLERNFYTTSSCGVCGKASIDAINTICTPANDYPYDGLTVNNELLCSLPGLLRSRQSVFDQTGGIHACALFDATGNLLLLREDVGRHNALDKLIGAALRQELLPLYKHILLLSGRASFELVQKAAMAGIRIVAAVGAPSSLAASLAEDRNMTLIGFLRGDRFNIYSGEQRIVI